MSCGGVLKGKGEAGRERGRTCRHGTAGRVDVEIDWLLRVVGFEEEELRDYGRRDFFVDLAI